MSQAELNVLIAKVKQCQLCQSSLNHGVNPVVQLHANAKLLIAGQAPGLAVHQSGVPFDDASGERLRQWLGIDKTVFYNPEQVAILPMGFCYPGKGKSGDLPPLKICAATWRERLLAELKQVQLTIVIGKYAQDYHLGTATQSLTQTVRNWADYPRSLIPLPHPSPRNNIWLAKNPWFSEQLLPELKCRVNDALKD
ncbi:IclR family transcriptional regulator [Shewanella sp. 10N.286.51.B7]|uniref:uracil-DNA glycosylase family protein n=1 Tax=Shewanella sp. 10N.286.51.B7 TaxID=1880836 RepID=UPI000C816066|nr:uracil-DNA glycosylase family protein [Shewanella sp. 10N.286.51.B7]PMG78483.1 IclR family transcriptional regulator [Shewanella sp. 10N.286.51.B7]